jgi:tetratricopeptide (TPR) repeat protein
MSAESAESKVAHLLQPTEKKYVRAVGPRLRILLFIVFALVALVGANSIYLASITFLEWTSQQRGEPATYQNHFYLNMFIVHLALGLVLILPFVVFGMLHMLASRKRRNRRAVKIGYALFAAGLIVLITGVLLVRIEGFFDLKQPLTRSLVYWLHVGCPLAAMWLYWLHRLAGPRIKWRIGLIYASGVAAVVLGMVFLQAQDPRSWHAVGPEEGTKYFEPSLARTATGDFIPADTLMMDEYCMKCHQDIYNGWFHSAHHLSSFNNPAYLASVRETREVALKRDGSVKAARWCAGCHDPVPFLSGAFDNPNYDDVNDPTAHAGVTCTVCHAITNVNTTRGNADYTIEEPLHYPFAKSDNAMLQYLNNTLVKAKPSFHKQTFLKDFHKTAEFCSACHKVHLPKELTNYKEFLRGQNHYDAYLLSGVSGHGARSFYYPPKAQENCNGCHMPLQESNDFGAKLFADATAPSIHSHLSPAANTGISWFENAPEITKAHQDFLAGTMRVDVFGIKEGGQVDGQLHAPLRPEVPALKRGESYLLETVIRTLKLGHLFTQGTVDSNEVWLDVAVRSGDRIIGRSGALDAQSEVDPWSHFVNVFMLDRHGNRIDRRNAQDIFVPLYNHQIPPGAGQVAHYGFRVPEDVAAPVKIDVKFMYRKFDKQYMDYVTQNAKPGDKPIRGHQPGQPYRNELPITVLAEDSVTFPIEGLEASVENPKREVPAWQRWNDYGIGLFLEGKAELRQATDAFAEVEKLGRYDGPLNQARVLHREGRLDEAVDAINRATDFNDPAPPWWTVAWLSGLVNREQGNLRQAEASLRDVVEKITPEMKRRGFDFSLDYQVVNLLGQTLFDRAKQEIGESRKEAREALLRQAIEQFERTLDIDEENVTAHYSLQLLYARLGDNDRSMKHRRDHARYKPDDNARDHAVSVARKKYPAANHAAEAFVIYPLQRIGAPGLDPAEARPEQSNTETGGAE